MNIILRALKTGVGLGLIVLAASACETDLTELELQAHPDPFLPVKCQPPSGLLADAPTQVFGMAALRPALEHVAGPMASALGESASVQELIRATQTLADGPVALDTACRLLIFASRALDEMPETPETLPDREGIRLIVLMSVSAFTARAQ